MKKIFLTGDYCKDIFIYGICSRLNPEAPTPVFREVYRTDNPGMAGNVYKNLQALGFDKIAFCTNRRSEITKIRYVDIKSNYILLRIDDDNTSESIDQSSILNAGDYDLVIISDYNKGFLKNSDIEFILSHSKLSFIDTKRPIDDWILDASFVKINEAEYNNIQNNPATLKMLEKNKKLIKTIGENGTQFNGKIFKPPSPIFVRDIVGAGDTFLASLAGHFLLNKNIEEAIIFANLCAGKVVEKKGIAYPDEKLLI
jgi:bifunctional ADP-heptose synthase (sugar kinase/adenylyltransferase)